MTVGKDRYIESIDSLSKNINMMIFEDLLAAKGLFIYSVKVPHLLSLLHVGGPNLFMAQLPPYLVFVTILGLRMRCFEWLEPHGNMNPVLNLLALEWLQVVFAVLKRT